ncbi:MAG: hypothetical protein KA383_12405 [Phycisphaerae bacterium]|nr:hypothetical protein [Phycisphaerae bacterium]
MLVFVSASDLTQSAALATPTTNIDLGYFTTGRMATVALRVGNQGSTSAAWNLNARDPFDDGVTCDIYPDMGFLVADEISDTVTVDITLPLDAYEIGHVADLILTDGSSETICELTFTPVQANVERRSQYPSRAGDATRISGNVIESLGDTLQVYVFQPVAYDPSTDDLISVEWQDKSIGGLYRGMKIVTAADPCERLNPHNEQWGYTVCPTVVRGQFQRESPSIVTTALEATGAPLRYNVSASLILPGWAELTPRLWAMFQPETETEPATYKRTVYLLKRQGVVYAIENIRGLDLGSDLSHFECDLIALHDAAMGSADYYNPFAVVYQYDSDKPYAVFTCPTPRLDTLLPDSSGSGSGAGWSGSGW